MKRDVRVWKHRGLGVWYSWVRGADRIIHSTSHPTHAAALHAALAAVGLAPEEER